jgi:hypothetical protein
MVGASYVKSSLLSSTLARRDFGKGEFPFRLNFDNSSGITLGAAPTKASCARFDKQNLSLENITFFLLPTGRGYEYLATVYRRWAQLKFSRSRSVPTKQAGKFSRTDRERLELLPWKQHCSSRPGYWLELHRAIRAYFLM